MLRLDAARLAALDPGLLIVRVIAVKPHEHAARSLDAALADLAEDRILLNALLRCLLILHCIASTAVQQAMITRAGAVDEVAFLNEHDIHATHCEVTQDSYARSAAADDNDCCFFHRETPLLRSGLVVEARMEPHVRLHRRLLMNLQTIHERMIVTTTSRYRSCSQNVLSLFSSDSERYFVYVYYDTRDETRSQYEIAFFNHIFSYFSPFV